MNECELTHLNEWIWMDKCEWLNEWLNVWMYLNDWVNMNECE